MNAYDDPTGADVTILDEWEEDMQFAGHVVTAHPILDLAAANGYHEVTMARIARIVVPAVPRLSSVWRPLNCDDGFVEKLEEMLGRALRKMKPGRKPGTRPVFA